MDKIVANLSAERAMIGCLTHRAELLDSLTLVPDHFSHFAFAKVFGIIRALHLAGATVNYRTIATRITEPDLSAIGGEPALLEMLHAEHWSAGDALFEELDRCLTVRRMAEVARWLATASCAAFDSETAALTLAELNRRVAAIESGADGENILGPVVTAIHEKLDRMDRGETPNAFRTSLPVWNEAFGGIVDGGFYALAGRPGRGKTSMAEQLVMDYMDAGQPVAMFEKDMSPQKLIERIACRSVGIAFWRFHRQKTSREENHRIRLISREIAAGNYIRLYNPVGLTADRLCAIARREIRQGVRCVILDHIQALSVGRDIREGLTAASLTLRRHVTETNVPLIALAHLNRKGAEGRPRPEDIKEFDQLYGDVDGMALLWHEPDQEDKTQKEIKFLVAKNRDGAETEETILFDGPMMRFGAKVK